MGLFQQLPEDPEEWAGLPAEPLPPESDAERLTDAGAVDAADLGFGGISGLGALGVGVGSGAEAISPAQGISSIVIPVELPEDPGDRDGDGEGGAG